MLNNEAKSAAKRRKGGVKGGEQSGRTLGSIGEEWSADDYRENEQKLCVPPCKRSPILEFF